MFFTGGVIQDNTSYDNSGKCEDSDGGVYSAIKGTVTYIKDYEFGDTTAREYMDFCIGDEVVEYFCNEKNLLVDFRIHCEEGCDDGACIITEPEEICEDNCGDGACDEIVCLAEGCPCAETVENCPEDCSIEN